MLTDEQSAFFDAFGFLVFRHVFSPEQIRRVTDEFESVLAEDRKGAQFAGTTRQAVVGLAEKRPALVDLIEDDRLYGPLQDLLGESVMYFSSDGGLYVGDSGWHADAPDGPPHFDPIKVALYLDPVTRDTGCLRVIPGSHRSPLHEAMQQLPFGLAPQDVPAVPLESVPGDVVLFTWRTWHASFGGRAGRRMLALSFAPRPSDAEQTAYIRTVYDMLQWHIDHQQVTKQNYIYEPEFLASDRPRVRDMVAPLVAMGLK